MYIIVEIYVLYNPTVIKGYLSRITEILKKPKAEYTQYFENNTEELAKILLLIVFALGILSWYVVGVLTFNWLAFLLFFIYAYLRGKTKKMLGVDKNIFLVRWSAVVNIIFYVFVILNSYHLQINLYQQLINLF